MKPPEKVNNHKKNNIRNLTSINMFYYLHFISDLVMLEFSQTFDF